MRKINYKGFTLIELLIVIVIIGIIATVILVSLNSGRARARDAKRKSDIKQIQRGLEIYFTRYGQYPTEGTCDSSRGTCDTCPCTGSDWDYTGGTRIGLAFRSSLEIQNIPIDPLNDDTYYYQYEPDCNQAGCVGLGCCAYFIRARLEAGGYYTLTNTYN